MQRRKRRREKLGGGIHGMSSPHKYCWPQYISKHFFQCFTNYVESNTARMLSWVSTLTWMAQVIQSRSQKLSSIGFIQYMNGRPPRDTRDKKPRVDNGKSPLNALRTHWIHLSQLCLNGEKRLMHDRVQHSNKTTADFICLIPPLFLQAQRGICLHRSVEIPMHCLPLAIQTSELF